MLKTLNAIEGYRLSAVDGEIGQCVDFLFDDEYWAVRYVVAETGSWLSARETLVSTLLLAQPRWDDRTLPVDQTREAIKSGPGLDEHAPVSRRYEAQYAAHFELPTYWAGPEAWGAYPPLFAHEDACGCPGRRLVRRAAEVR